MNVACRAMAASALGQPCRPLAVLWTAIQTSAWNLGHFLWSQVPKRAARVLQAPLLAAGSSLLCSGHAVSGIPFPVPNTMLLLPIN